MSTKSNYNFFCFIPDECWEVYTRRPHLAPLMKYGQLIVIEAPITVKKLFKRSNIKLILSLKFKHRISEDGIIVIRPLVLIPIKLTKKLAFLKWLYFSLLRVYLKRYLRSGKTNIVLLFYPFQKDYVKQFNERITTFDFSDKFSLNPVIQNKEKKKRICLEEETIIKKVDIVFATSLLLSEEAKRLNKYTYWLPNTIEDDFIKNENRCPKDITSLRRPIIGFVANINDWCDFKLINYLAEKRKEYNFVFIGDIKYSSNDFLSSDDYLRSLTMQNIYYLGHKNYSDLYFYIKKFDVCTIYYKIDEFKKYVHPNKIYMYLSTGRPIVSTNFFPEAKKTFGEMVRFVDSYEEFDEAIEEAVNEKNSKLAKLRIEYAKANSNLSRAKKRFELIDEVTQRNKGYKKQ